jgi:hypothetical protein
MSRARVISALGEAGTVKRWKFWRGIMPPERGPACTQVAEINTNDPASIAVPSDKEDLEFIL